MAKKTTKKTETTKPAKTETTPKAPTEPRDPRAGKGPFYDCEIVDEKAKRIDAVSMEAWKLFQEGGWDKEVGKRLEREAKALFVTAIYQQKAAGKAKKKQ